MNDTDTTGTDNTVTQDLVVHIHDDGPTAKNDRQTTVKEGGITVVSDDTNASNRDDGLMLNDTEGADGAKIVRFRYTDESGVRSWIAVPDDAIGTTVDTQYGNLTILSDGSWEYTSDVQENHPAG